jgi:hypothetical protein
MNKLLSLQIIAIFCCLFFTASGQVKQFSQIITVNDYTYEIEVGGTRDPVNRTIIIENLGNSPVINPRITVNGNYDWFDLKTMANEITRGCSTDEEKALAIFDFIRLNFHHLDSPGDRECHNPVIALNIYGYANCAYHSTVFTALCKAVGVPARVWEVWHHTVSEAYYNNSWHMLDSDIGLYYLADDNRTIASVEQLWEDQKISGGISSGAAKTKFSGRNKAVRAVYTDAEGENAAVSQDGERIRGYRYFHGPDFCYVQTGYDKFTFESHNMAMTLRPGEKLIRNWKGGEKYYDYERHNRSLESGNNWAKPILYGDGEIIWKPDLKSEIAPSFFNINQAPLFGVNTKQIPAVHVRNRHGGIYDMPERAIMSVHTPYTILGGKINATLYRGAATEWDRLSATITSNTGPVSSRVWTAPEGATGFIKAEINLDKVLFPTGERGRHDYAIEFNFMANENNNPVTQSGLEEVEFITEIQVSPNSLPALSKGRNIIRYRDETQGRHQVKITHIWLERNDYTAPGIPEGPVFPGHGETINTLAPVFKWKDSDIQTNEDKITNYCILLSFDPFCRWPVATALYKETNSDLPEWELPAGWLNHNTTYYWKVKAQSNYGVWSDWSEIYRFTTHK